jgi:D-glycero-alpha-D-manno-heptose-7-phosphate kinase
MVHTKHYRSASAILEEQVKVTREGKVDNDLGMIKALAYEAKEVFMAQDVDKALKELGSMLSETWKIKRSLSSSISNQHLDEIYNKAMSLGALGGKLAGAGGGGFFVFLAPDHAILKMKQVFGDEAVVKIALQEEGSRVKEIV